jgi:hypothetical protein
MPASSAKRPASMVDSSPSVAVSLKQGAARCAPSAQGLGGNPRPRGLPVPCEARGYAPDTMAAWRRSGGPLIQLFHDEVVVVGIFTPIPTLKL